MDMLQKILQGTYTEEDARRILEWSRSKNAEDDLEHIFDSVAKGEKGKDFSEEINSKLLLEKIEAEIVQSFKDEEPTTASVASGRTVKMVVRSVLKYAAVVVLVAFSVVFVMQQIEEAPVSDWQEKPSPIIWKKTDKGQKLTVKLSDGSKVVLNSGSSISYPQYFTNDSREITLVGEAYFEVARDTLRPFSVRAGETVTTALGTSFNIDAYDTNEINIALATGKVKVHTVGLKDRVEKYLTPGHAITYQREKADFIVSEFEYRKYFLWKEGIIHFRDASFGEIVDKLEMWYGVDIQSDLKPAGIKPYTGEFDDESLVNVLNSMSYSLDFYYKIEDKKVEIMSNQTE